MELPEYLIEMGVSLDLDEVAQGLATTWKEFPLFHTRKESLFLRFLPVGYSYMTLSSIDSQKFFELLLAKTKIGMLITLYDDLADHPERKNPSLLQELYKIPSRIDEVNTKNFSAQEKYIFEYSLRTWQEVLAFVATLPYYEKFKTFFFFDIQQFYNANWYSELISAYPQMANQTENRIYLSHNMGMIITGMVDLMATPNGFFAELGAIRHILFQGQILGRMSNVLTTLERELSEGDVTNEVLSKALQERQIEIEDLPSKSIDELRQLFQPIIKSMYEEREQLYSEILCIKIRTLDVKNFVSGVKHLHSLHQSMQGEI